jgi:hypothetical protein
VTVQNIVGPTQTGLSWKIRPRIVVHVVVAALTGSHGLTWIPHTLEHWRAAGAARIPRARVRLAGRKAVLRLVEGGSAEDGHDSGDRVSNVIHDVAAQLGEPDSTGKACESEMPVSML